MAATPPVPYLPRIRDERDMRRHGQRRNDVFFYGLMGGVTLAAVLLVVGPGRSFLDCRAGGRTAWSCLVVLLGLG